MRTSSKPITDRRWLRLGAAADLLGVSITTLRRWSDAGKIPCYRSAGGHRRFRRSDIDAIIAGQARGAAGRRAAPSAPAAADAVGRLEARNRDLELLVQAGIEDASHLSTEEVLHSVARRVARLTRSPVADIYAVEGENLRALVSFDGGSFDRSWEGTIVRLRDYPCSWIAADERRIAVASSLDDPVLTTTGRASLEKWGYQSQLSAPLEARDEVIGILELSDYVPRDFSEHMELISGLAHVAGRALENAGLFEEIRRRNVILHELVELGALVTGAHDVTELLRAVARRLVEALDVADCDVFTLAGDTLYSRVSYDRNGYDDVAVGHSLRIDEFPNTRRAIETQDIAVITSPAGAAAAGELAIFDEYGFQSNLSLPLVVDGVVHGLIDIYDDSPRDFAEYLDFLKTVGQLIAGALEKTLLLERLEQGNNELQLLVDAGLEFGSTLELDEVLFSVAERIRTIVDAEVCEVYGIDAGGLITRMCVDRNGRDDREIGFERRLSDRPAAQRAIESREPFAIENAATDEHLTAEEREYFLGMGYPASVRMPLTVHGAVIGLVGVYDTAPRSFDRIQLLQGLAQIAAQAMANARLMDEAKHRADVLRELVDLGTMIWRTRDVDSLVRLIAQRLTATIGAASCEIYRCDDDGHTLCLASWDQRAGRFDHSRCGEPLTPPESYRSILNALEKAEPLVVSHRADQRLSDQERAIFAEWGFHSELCIPVIVESRVVGLIDLFDAVERDFHEYMDFVRSVGQMVAGAFENATLLDRLNGANRELETLVRSGLDFGSSLDLEHVLNSVAARMLEVSSAACCEIYAVEGDSARGLLSIRGDGADPDFPGAAYDLTSLATLADTIRDGEPVPVVDCRVDTRLSGALREEWVGSGYVSALLLPFSFGGQVTGIVTLFDTRPREFEHLDLLRGLAQIAAPAMANATLFRRLDASSRRLAVVHDTSLEFSSTLELRDILLSTAHRLCEIAEAPTCDIYFISGTDLVCVASVKSGVVVDEGEGEVNPLDAWAADKLAITTRSTVQISSLDDLRRSPAEIKLLKEYGYEAELIVPLVAKDRVIGVVELLDCRQRRFTPDTVATVEAVCHAAALAIDNANLFEGLQMRRRETELLNAIARRTASSLRLDEIAAATADELRQLIPFERANLVLTTGDGQLQTIYSSERWLSGPELHGHEQDELDTLETVRRKRVVVWEPGTVPPIGEERVEGRPGDAGASIALLRGEELIGVLSLSSSEPRLFAAVDRRLLERVGTHLSLAINNARLYEEIKRMHLGNLKALSSALNAKDYYTLGHAARVGAYMVLLGHELGWPEDMTHQVEEAAYLHDIGKIGVSDRVLLKPSGLNSREWDLMRQHPIFSADIIRPLFSEDLVLGVRHHHERWDGGGYPDGLAGEDIPLVARAMCVVDSYDAMSFRRPYRQALWYNEALAELDSCRGTQFDPEMVDAFKQVLTRLEGQHKVAREIAAIAAARIDPDKHVLLRDPSDERRPEYREIATALRDVRDAHPPTRFLTTHARVGDNKYAIIVDCEEPAETHSRLGSEVFADEELPEVFNGATPEVNVLYVDEWGVWITGLAPIVNERGEVVAVTSADLPPAGVTGAELEGLRSDVAQTFASMLQTTAARLSRAELDAITDGLTGLYNHRYLHERLSEEIERAREQNRSLSLLFCDLDEFKAFNDLHGHSAGDSALRGVARVIDGCVRRVDLAARYGGEEFAVILIETDTDGAVEVADRIRRDVASAQFVQGRTTDLTISIGVATFPDDAGMKEELLDKADWAMYLAKRQGRDKVVTFAAGQSGEVPAALAPTPGRTHLSALAEAVDAKFEVAGGRSREAARLAGLVASELKLGGNWVDEAVEAARLADIGEIGVPDEVLNKPGELTADEWRLIREHPVTGERLLRSLGATEQLIQAVVHHHERFDGGGYPAGLAGEAIPLHSRIVLVAAAFAAMTGPRSHAPVMDERQAMAELQRCSGTQFDPQIVDALDRVLTHDAVGVSEGV
jgi:diguanylate cyclase (GGDEF)-like protein/excisionase family DNA binding protein